jgi:hypothetical protein
MRANTWGFPAVKKARIINTKKSIRNAQSTISRNVGWREEPGCKMVEKKDSDALSGLGVDSDIVAQTFKPIGHSRLEAKTAKLLIPKC